MYFKNYDRFSGFIIFWSRERNNENTMQHLYFNEKAIILRKIQATIKTFAPPFSTISVWSWSGKKWVNAEFVCSQSFLRSSCSQILFNKCVLQNFANLTGKHVCIKKIFHHRWFSLKSANFLRTSFFTEHLRWLPLKLNMYVLQLWIYYILE